MTTLFCEIFTREYPGIVVFSLFVEESSHFGCGSSFNQLIPRILSFQPCYLLSLSPASHEFHHWLSILNTIAVFFGDFTR